MKPKVISSKKPNDAGSISSSSDLFFTGFPENLWGHTLLSRNEENTLFNRIKKNPKDDEAFNELILMNLKLVSAVATGYVGACRTLTYEDLMQEGFIGLMIALGKFNPDRGYRFSTYASWWILQAISLSVKNNDSLIRIPKSAISFTEKISEEIIKYIVKNGIEPTLSELLYLVESGGHKTSVSYIANLLGMPPDGRLRVSVPGGQSAGGVPKTISLDSPIYTIDGDQPFSLGEFLPDFRVIDPACQEGEVRQKIKEIIKKIYSIDKKSKDPKGNMNILLMRLGLKDGIEYTLEEIGGMYKITRERVRQIIDVALEKLRAEMANHPEFSDYVEYFERKGGGSTTKQNGVEPRKKYRVRVK